MLCLLVRTRIILSPRPIQEELSSYVNLKLSMNFHVEVTALYDSDSSLDLST
jgi:hypothetical protein